MADIKALINGAFSKLYRDIGGGAHAEVVRAQIEDPSGTAATPLSETTFTGRMGEVQASPTANTLLGRLKAIADAIGGTLLAAPAPATLTILTATIAQDASLSDAVDLAGLSLLGILMPATWDAAGLTFQGSTDGVTYGNVYDESGNEYTVQAAASRAIGIDAASPLLGFRYIKVRSGTAASAVNQTTGDGPRAISLAVRPL